MLNITRNLDNVNVSTEVISNQKVVWVRKMRSQESYQGTKLTCDADDQTTFLIYQVLTVSSKT